MRTREANGLDEAFARAADGAFAIGPAGKIVGLVQERLAGPARTEPTGTGLARDDLYCARGELTMPSLICRAVVVAVGLGLALGGSAWAQTPWKAPESEKSKKSPIAASAKVAEQGKKVAEVNCVSCHGKGGKGDGAAAMALNPKPADWTSKKIQDETDGELFWKITNGRGAMPAWRHLSESDRWALTQHIRTLKK